MTTTRYYRVHDTSLHGTALEDLLRAEHQVSRVWIGSVFRRGVEIAEQAGVSVCRSVDDLRGYFAERLGYVRDGVVLVELEGDEVADDEDVDVEHGALLVRPTRIVRVWTLDTSATDVAEALDLPMVEACDAEDLEWINSWAGE